MKSLMEEREGETFDWNKFLKNAIRRKTPMDDDELNKAVKRAQSWVTCACGNTCSIIPRYKGHTYEDDDAPIDDELRSLGVRFFGLISDLEWIAAKEILKDIEARSAVLIHKELQKHIDILEEYGYTVSKAKFRR